VAKGYRLTQSGVFTSKISHFCRGHTENNDVQLRLHSMLHKPCVAVIFPVEGMSGVWLPPARALAQHPPAWLLKSSTAQYRPALPSTAQYSSQDPGFLPGLRDVAAKFKQQQSQAGIPQTQAYGSSDQTPLKEQTLSFHTPFNPHYNGHF